MIQVISVIISFAVTALMGIKYIPWLRAIKCGQHIKEDGPTWHKDKEGIPTMGGVMFITGFCIALAFGIAALAGKGEKMGESGFRLFAGVVICFLFSLIGLVDDLAKLRHKTNDGITAKQKLLFQTIIALGYSVLMNIYGGLTTELDIPLIGCFDLGFFYYPLMVFSIVGIVNSVNLTDGLDGLASSVTLVVTIGFAVICGHMEREYEALFCYALIGCLCGFLVWNFKPAKVFMGDTGSMFLGGAVVAMAFNVHYQLLMLLAGVVYVCEAFSDLIQFAYFRATHGGRFFKMAPIHHHFERCGWGEVKIIIVFSVVAAIGTFLSVLAAFAR